MAMTKPECLLRAGLLFLVLSCTRLLNAQSTTFPVNGLADPRSGCYAFTNATLVKDGQTTITEATLLIRDGRIVAAGKGVALPKDAVVLDCSGKFIYPSLIDIYSDYGIPTPQRQAGERGFFAPQQFTSSTKGAVGWNQAIRSEVNGIDLFSVDDSKAKPLRDIGFGTVLTHQKDGIARGTGAVVTLAAIRDNKVIVKEKASAHYSFSKGTSSQSYPGSIMGAVALLRQTYIDAAWYRNRPAGEGLNLSLEAWNASQTLPQIFEAGDKWSEIRADRIGDEFGVQYIIKGGSNEYQRIKEIAATKANFIISLNYPEAQNVEDPADARFVSLGDMQHWELAAGNAAALEKAGISFALTTSDLRDAKQFWPNLRKAIQYGLSEARAMDALTRTPAMLLGVYDKVGSLDAGKLANFLITTGNIFQEKTQIVENWVQGERYNVRPEGWEIQGLYKLTLRGAGGTTEYNLDIKSASSATVWSKDTLTAKFTYNAGLVSLTLSPRSSGRGAGRPGAAGNASGIRLSGARIGNGWQGTGVDTLGKTISWTAVYQQAGTPAPDTGRKRTPSAMAHVTYPFGSYGNDTIPVAKSLLIRNATVWTNEKDGKLEGVDVVVRNGKIAKVGRNLSEAGATVIDGTGKHLTAGVIDEHSHIAAFSINEGAQSVTSEVRIGDNLNPDDVNIYRQLSGGVTTSHILHGSANTIGGQTQLIKLRWGADDEGLKFKGADPFIKFALGENVKRTASTQGNSRFPDTRMGVEEVLADAFQRARDYRDDKTAKNLRRRDLELDALVEIMENKRFITCHSYVQSEITALLRVADKYGFKVNTFTHILEGYKVADKMKERGANASTFSDWWAYKMEVQDAIAYNAAIMHKVGLNVCINSDDAEMARRLNQEAAKAIKYGGVSEEDALKMVTLNPAKALHIDKWVGSIREGKDADLVLWSDHPLSIYAKALYTIVDGTIYFDRQKDEAARVRIAAEKNRLVQKMIAEGRSSGTAGPARPTPQVVLHCEEYDHRVGLLETDEHEENEANHQ